jgi:hypothetical protein
VRKRRVNEVDLLEEPLEKRQCLDELKKYVSKHYNLLLRQIQILMDRRDQDREEKEKATAKELKDQLVSMDASIDTKLAAMQDDMALMQGDMVAMRSDLNNPAGEMVKSIRKAAKRPALRKTCNPDRFPSDQQASRADIVGCMSLQLALSREIEKPRQTLVGVEPGVKLHYGGWTSLRNLFGRRALQLRLADHARGLCARPRLWARGGPNDNAGIRYVFSADEAESCVRRILRQRYNAQTSIRQHVYNVIATTDPEEWPANDVDIEPEWQHC